ncbi:MAG: quinonprotein alcohol dehydrogenase [Thermoleophilia bacterium]|nr:quinonprotein alcohol dehydrogenase [Thermoleophilia bacterium]
MPGVGNTAIHWGETVSDPLSQRSKQRSSTKFSWFGRGALVALLVLIGVFVAACGGDDDKDSESKKLDFPKAFPAFDGDYLTALPEDNWITNGGTVSNDRYSPLDQINDKNVKDLKGEWKVDLESGTEIKYSHEAQPLEYNGILYVPTGEDDVFAIDAMTGKTKWKYEGELDENISTVCCGWLSRGVGIGDGMVFIGKLDGHMVALDQETGEVEWDVEVAHWKKDNAGITAAPLYYDGVVYTGITGGEFGVRGRLTALDAKTGEEKWRFYTTPGPDEVGGDTWEGDSYLTGGAPIWQTPTVDPKLGMIYFTTGNANPDVDGSERGGDNLFAASFVALDLKTGKHKWHYQTVHHDIWDYDQPSPTILYDAEIDGKTVPAIGQAAKTGWFYALDRRTGEPIWDIKEEPVPQNAQQKTAKTQPVPQYEAFATKDITAKHVTDITALIRANPEGKTLDILPAGKTPADATFTPAGPGQVAVVANGATGGTNWPPSSYNHESNLIYVCGIDGISGVYPSGVTEVEEGSVRLGSILAALPFGSTPGHLTAIDGDTGEIEWKVDYEDSCYSGSVTTAGNLVFSGHNDGTLVAYAADTGKKLWSFQTGAGANSTVTPFEHKGKQYIAFVAGGNSLAASAHGDNLWVFSLDGKLEQMDGIEGAAPAGGGEHAGIDTDKDAKDEPGEPIPPSDADADGEELDGEALFRANCAGCHGANAKGANGGPNITESDDIEDIKDQIVNGGGGMPAFGDDLSDEEVTAIAEYLATL